MSQLGPFFLPLSSWSMGLVTCTTYNYTNSIQFSSRRYIMLFCAQTCSTELQHVKETQLGEETQGAQTANQQPLAFFSHLRWSKGKWKGRQSPQNTSTLLIPMWGKSSKGEESLKISMGFPWWREFFGSTHNGVCWVVGSCATAWCISAYGGFWGWMSCCHIAQWQRTGWYKPGVLGSIPGDCLQPFHFFLFRLKTSQLSLWTTFWCVA